MISFGPERASLRRPSPTLTFDDAVEVWRRHFLGEAQHHIAQAFGVNQGRVSEILTAKRHVGSRTVALRGDSRASTNRKSSH
jgi:hypothetical protein